VHVSGSSEGLSHRASIGPGGRRADGSLSAKLREVQERTHLDFLDFSLGIDDLVVVRVDRGILRHALFENFLRVHISR